MPLNTRPGNFTTSGYKGKLDAYQGRVALNAQCDFTAAAPDLANATAYEFDFGQVTTNGIFDIPRSVFIDNSLNPNQVFIDVSKTPFNIPIPPFAVAILETFAEPGSKITLTSIGGATGLTDVSFFNTRENPIVYFGFALAGQGTQVSAALPTATMIIQRNFDLAPNVAHNVFPAVAKARQLFYRVVGDEPVFANLVGVAASGSFGNGDITVQPGNGFQSLPFLTAAAVSFFYPNGGAAGDAKIEAFEVYYS